MVTKRKPRVPRTVFDMSTNSRFAVAVHVLSLMAWSGEEPLKSEQVAESVNTNPVVIRRMLLELAEAGLVVSQTGSLGARGWQMTPQKPPFWTFTGHSNAAAFFRFTGNLPVVTALWA